ncbi:hypothetical protein N0V93_008123 [Gnomoniopsis smithogilvyi]|uniref:Uncharacterized protein n=1 Tax=Gnomoniopsis smithogilvyi TaxID=1191159 RepID=A0A9W9CUF7_9PEZI|nr:hypothetical protein N0V93_008123 [Gnomoniopsis smithogilvyi]
MDRSLSDQSPTPTDQLQLPRSQERQNRISSLPKSLLTFGGDIMARVTRSSAHKATPTPTPTKPADADADTLIESIETTTRRKDSQGPYQRKPRKKRSRDVKYKIKKRQLKSGEKREALDSLDLPKAEQESLRAGSQGNKTAQKLVDVVLKQRAEINRLEKQLNGDIQDSEDSAVTPAPSNDPTEAGSRHRQAKTAA